MALVASEWVAVLVRFWPGKVATESEWSASSKAVMSGWSSWARTEPTDTRAKAVAMIEKRIFNDVFLLAEQEDWRWDHICLYVSDCAVRLLKASVAQAKN